MRFIVLIAVLCLLASAAEAAAPEKDLIELNDELLMKQLDSWFKPDICKENAGEYFYISLGHDDISVFKIKRSLYQRASMSSWAVISQDEAGNLKSWARKNVGCRENPLRVMQVFITAPKGTVDTGVEDDLFMLRLDASRGQDAGLIKLRDSGKATEVHKGLLYSAGEQTVEGVKQPVAYFLAKDPKDLQKSGGPMRARCLPGKAPKTLVCSVIDAINKDAVYEAVLPIWPPKLEDIHKLHAQMESLVESLRVK